MNLKTGQAIALSAALMVVSGCGSTSSFKNLFASNSVADQEAGDPLANVPGKVSEEFLAAKKELNAPEHTLLQFARWREDMGDQVAAMDRYREILKANDQCVAARLGIARIEQATGRTEAAQQILEATAKQHPELSDVWISMGQLHASRNNYPAAITSLQKAVDLDSRDQGARYELGLAYARNGQVDMAEPHLNYAVGQSAASYNIGYVLNDLGRKQEAVQWFEQAISRNPDERTLMSTQKMLASLKASGTGTMIAQNKEPSKVNVELTSYEAYRETPEIAVEPRAQYPAAQQTATQQTAAQYPAAQHSAAQHSAAQYPAVNSAASQSVFRQAVQSRVIESPDGSLRSAMSTLGAQAGEAFGQSNAGQGISGRAKVESVPNWNGPSASPTAAPLIQNSFGQRQSSVVQPGAWPSR
ncbi:MAG: tetratricopeptide repeat protein [Fuerstiella sp.]